MPEWILDINKAINQAVWGVPMLLLLVGTGIYFTFSLRFIQISRIREWMGETFGSLLGKREREKGGGISPYKAVSAALASSVGTGNIVGVATAITAGGAGAVFWMWVSAIFGMATKYAEIVLAVRFSEKNSDGTRYGGPMYYIEKGIGADWKWLSMLFALFAAAACPGMGGMNQSNTIAAIMHGGLSVKPEITGLVLAVITFATISGGIKRISSVAEKIVPIMAFFYIAGGIYVLLSDIPATIGAIKEIFRLALMPEAVYGGASGYMVMQAVRYGVARGVFSNEAGLGSAPMIHAAANAKSPVKQGFWGMFEVFVDTILICTVTALVIISSGEHFGKLEGSALTVAAFSKGLGRFGGVFVGTATVLFSLTTILGWSYYGEQCVAYLTNRSRFAEKAYKAVFIASVAIGAVSRVDIVWEISDTLNGLMAMPNLIALLILSGVVIKLTREEFSK